MLRSLAFRPADGLSPGRDERRISSFVRAVLAATALVATFVDPSEPSRFVAATYVVLAVYLIYALLLHMTGNRGAAPSATLLSVLPWVDVGVYAVLIGMSGGSNSIYFVLFFFGILIASFHGGFGYGAAVTAVSTLLFVTVGYASRPADPSFDLNRFLLRSSALPVLGYLIAFRGGYELNLRRRLTLLRDISMLSNPRFGVDRMLARSLERLRGFFDADACVAILSAEAGRYELRRAGREPDDRPLEPEPISPELAAGLLAFKQGELACFRPRRSRPLVSFPTPGSPESDERVDRAGYELVAERLGSPAFLTVPLRAGTRVLGRLFVTARDPTFEPADCDFLLQVADQVVPALAHIELVERMAMRAAEDERQRIALDIHDRLIQPYIGLQIGLKAVEQLASSGDAALVRERLTRLSGLAALGLADLRGYVQGLRDTPTATGGLAQSLQRFARRFQEVTGIEIALAVDGDVSPADPLAAELFSMASEALSNVRRHTTAPSARVILQQHTEWLVLRVENPTDPDRPGGTFVPRSIAQRATACGGRVNVETGDGRTAVTVEIPL